MNYYNFNNFDYCNIILIIILNIKKCVSKLSIKILIKRKQQSKKGLYEFRDVGNLQKTFVTSRKTFVSVMKQLSSHKLFDALC